MVHKLVGNSELVAHMERKIGHFEEKNLVCNCFRSNQMSYTNQITIIAPDGLYIKIKNPSQ